jgi:DNA-directed RNA polymerase subunit RPC12/RpoP
MTPVEMIKEGVRVKSWAMIKAALKEIEEKQLSLEEYPSQATEDFRQYNVPKTARIPNDLEPYIEIENSTKKTKKEKTKSGTNLFYDDGNTTKIGDTPIDSALVDKKIKYKDPPERTRAQYKQKFIKCSKCSKDFEISDVEYSYYKNPMNEADYICQNCT